MNIQISVSTDQLAQDIACSLAREEQIELILNIDLTNADADFTLDLLNVIMESYAGDLEEHNKVKVLQFMEEMSTFD